MDAKRCDRCGKFYSNGVEDQANLIDKLGGKQITIKVEGANAYQTVRFVDLCDTCSIELRKWLGI